MNGNVLCYVLSSQCHFSFRLAVESQGNESVTLAPQHLLSCDRRGQSGCKGGHVDRAWQYLRKIGYALVVVIMGGEYVVMCCWWSE